VLIFPPPKFRPHRARRERAPSQAGLTITQVKISAGGPFDLVVTFSGPITWNGIDLPMAFQSFTTDGFFDSPVGVIAVGTNWIQVEFNGDTLVGSPWQVIGAMEGITPAVAWPQAGVVVA